MVLLLPLFLCLKYKIVCFPVAILLFFRVIISRNFLPYSYILMYL